MPNDLISTQSTEDLRDRLHAITYGPSVATVPTERGEKQVLQAELRDREVAAVMGRAKPIESEEV